MADPSTLELRSPSLWGEQIRGFLTQTTQVSLEALQKVSACASFLVLVEAKCRCSTYFWISPLAQGALCLTFKLQGEPAERKTCNLMPRLDSVRSFEA
jgi:hypothetical protein